MSPSVAAQDRRRRARWFVLAVALAVVGTACLGAALLRSSGAGAQVEADRSSVPVERPERTVGTPLRRPTSQVPPVHLSIPAIDVSQRLLRLGLQPDRTVEVPAPRDAAFPGWFKLGARPGQVGSAVILGHVDSLQGPAIFYRLRYLKPGDHVDVRLDDATMVHFVVRRVAIYPNEAFPARLVYASHGYPALNLVTCGGAYDRERGGYQSNVVVYTRLAHTRPTDLDQDGSSRS